MSFLASLGHIGRRPVVIVTLVVVALLVAARIALPFVLTDYLSSLLDAPPNYEGEVAGVDLHFWRGAASVQGVRIDQIDDGKRELLFRAPEMHGSVSWRAVLRGSLVGEVEIVRPVINIVTPPEEAEEEKLRLEDLVERFRQVLPFVIDRFTLKDAELHFHDPSARPPIDIYIDQFQVTARNLTNSERLSNDLWGTVSATGRAMGSGDLELQMRLNPSEPRPTYDLAFELKDLRLPALNNYLKHYLSVTARDGRLSLYAESTARDGRFEGYVKPIVKDLDVIDVKEEQGVGEAVKGFFVKLMAQIFENEPKEQVATRIPFSGSFENPETSVWAAVVMFVRNAFVRALAPRLEGSVAPKQAEKVIEDDTEERQPREQPKPRGKEKP